MQARTFKLIVTAILILAAALAGSASGIDNCCFVDRQCHSDQEWVDGYWAFQNNQCPAPASSQPTGDAPAQVDNCCFVDRQCNTELQWIAGYHAYQNNQCAAPGQAPAGSSFQPAGGVILRTATGIVYGSASGRGILPSTGPSILPTRPGQIISRSNCCEENWQCNSDQDWAEGYHAFQNSCALPGLISIVGDPDFVTYYEQRLDLLKNRLPHRYNYVLSGLDKIEQQRNNPWSSVDVGRRTFFVHWNGPSVDGWDTRASAVLVHEACHVHRFDAGYGRYQICDHEAFTREEVICREKELEVVIELGAEPHIIEWAHEMVARTRRGLKAPIPEGGC